MAAISADKKGMKRICPSCSTRFYDFNKRPINCPNCKTEFTGEIKARARRSRPANDISEDGQVTEATAAKKKRGADEEEDDDILVDAEEGVVSLEDLDDDKEVIEEDEDAGDPDLELDEDVIDDDLDDEDDDLDDDDDDDEDDLDDEDDDDEDDSAKPKRKKK